MALVAVGVPWLLGPRAGIGGPGGGPSLEPMATPTVVPLAHAEKWMLAFDYPANWTLLDRHYLDTQNPVSGPQVPMLSGSGSMGFVGTGSAQETCASPGQNMLPVCTTQWTLPAGSVVVRFWIDEGPGWNGITALSGTQFPGWVSVAVDGLPSLFVRSMTGVAQAARSADQQPEKEEVVPGADEVLSWAIPDQFANMVSGYVITAAIRGPNVAEQEAQVRTLIDSLHWVPEPYKLPTGAALDQARPLALTKALAALKADAESGSGLYGEGGRHMWDCFPSEVGVGVTATTIGSQQGLLTTPLPVTCMVDSIVPNVMQGWTLTLSQTWVAGADYPAGKGTMVFYLAADGTIAQPHLDQTVYPHRA
jgi:hypothetical protein